MTGMNADPISFHTPAQDLLRPEACPAEPAALAAWLDNLPVANIGETARHLFLYTSELTRVPLHPDVRIALAELLRHRIHYATQALERHYLNQPVVLPPQPRKVAQLAQSLQGLLARLYLIACNQVDEASPATLATAVHRALTELGCLLMRSAQLYAEPPARTWLELHKLYQLAEQRGLVSAELEDVEHGGLRSHIRDAYLRAVLMGCAKTNQLRQADIGPLFTALGQLARHAALGHKQEDSTYFIEPRRDGPARYTAQLKGHWEADFIGIGTTDLLARLREGAAPELSESTREHLLRAFSPPQKRNFTRIPIDSEIEVCAGLSALHYMLAGEHSFSEFLLSAQTAPKPKAPHTQPDPMLKRDVWDAIYAPGHNVQKVNVDHIDYSRDTASAGNRSTEYTGQHHSQQVRMVNVSAGGCCLRWEEQVPSQIKAGEIVGIREQGHADWSIATIRWIRTTDEHHTLLGLELLSPTGIPVAARVFRTAGEHGEFMRGIELPALPLLGQPPTLLLPRVPFRERQRIQLASPSQQVEAQLIRKLGGTAAFSQFEFEINPLWQGRQPGTGGKQHDSFDALWDKL